MLRLSCVVHGPIYITTHKTAPINRPVDHTRDVTHILSKVSCFYWNPFIFVGYRNDRFFSYTNPYISAVFRVLRGNADGHISSLRYPRSSLTETKSSRKESSFPAEMPLIKSVGLTNRQLLPVTPRKWVALYQRTPRLGCDMTNAKTYKLPWKTGTLTSFQKPRLQPVSFFSKFVHLRLLCISCVIYTASFNVLSDYFCFTQFGDRFYCLNFDKFRYAAPLMNQWKNIAVNGLVVR